MGKSRRSLTATGGAPPSVLIVDDSVVARTVMARAIDATGRLMVAGMAANVPAALDFLTRTRVDAIVLDIEMPGVDGLTALPDLIAAGRGARILIVSSACDDGAPSTLQALALGAADTLVKPHIGAFAGHFARTLCEKLERLAQPELPTIASRAPRGRDAPGDDFDIVAIGASTGGIHALSLVLRALPADFSVPILITQHLPDSFMQYFAAQVSVLAGRPCEVAEERARVRPGRVLLAPGDAHLRIVRTSDAAAVRLSNTPVASGCVPSVDPMFDSVAEVYGDRALCVVLSGMGRDGVIGAQSVARAGGSQIVQDRASSVVWGMPGAVVAAGLADAVLEPAEIGRLLARRRRPA